MAAKTENKQQKTGFFSGVRSEFKKIVWPKRDQLLKETCAVTIVTLLLAAIIKLVDMVMQTGIAVLIK